jgi:hypothetical protein
MLPNINYIYKPRLLTEIGNIAEMKNEHPVQTYKLLGIGHSNAFKIGCMRNMVIAETNQQCCSQIPLVFSTLREISVQYIDRR